MITIALAAYSEEDGFKLVLGGDKGYVSLPSHTLLPRKPFVRFGDYPVFFSYGGCGTAVISDFAYRIEEFLYDTFKARENFSTLKLKNNFSGLFSLLKKMNNFYYNDTGGIVFDGLLCGGDEGGNIFIYYIKFGENLEMNDMFPVPGYGITLHGHSGGLSLMRHFLNDSLPDVFTAQELVVQVIRILSQYKYDVIPEVEVVIIDNGEVKIISKEPYFKDMCDFIESRWDALKIVLLKEINDPGINNAIVKRVLKEVK